jgi:hypothetical protein
MQGRHYICQDCGFTWYEGSTYYTSPMHRCKDGNMRTSRIHVLDCFKLPEEAPDRSPVARILTQFKQGDLTMEETIERLKKEAGYEKVCDCGGSTHKAGDNV